MKSLTASLFARLAVVCAVAIAMVGVGFAHRAAPVAYDAGLSAYLSAGGTLAALCVDADGTGHQSTQSCDACRLVDTAALAPVPRSCAGHLPFSIAYALPALPATVPAQTEDPSRPVRAPPVV